MKRANNNNLGNERSWTKMAYPKSTLHALFAKQAEINPDSIAIEFENEQLTYAELAKKTNQMANYFLAQGVSPGQIVAVSMERTPKLIASLFAILPMSFSMFD